MKRGSYTVPVTSFFIFIGPPAQSGFGTQKPDFRGSHQRRIGALQDKQLRQSGYTNPLGELNRVWNETYMSANMESILVGYDDPRLGAYFEHCTDEALKGQYRGIRQGTCFAHSHYSGLSEAVNSLFR